MPEVLTFAQAIADSEDCDKRNLLLGNGFSIACKPDIFHYDSLYAKADFSGISAAKKAFEALKTQDFEVVIRALEQGSVLAPIYMPTGAAGAKKMAADAGKLKDLLISTVANNHPARPGDIPDRKFLACRRFLAHFLAGEKHGRVYTLNYDLLLYWTLMHDDDPFDDNPADITTIDGFGADEDDPGAEYVVWKAESKANKQCVHYLHGALHLYDAGAELKKYTWIRSGKALIDQAREAVAAGAFPLFVSEGDSESKQAKIRRRAYLQHSLKSFHSVVAIANQSLFVFGHSLAANDDHVLNRVGRGKCKKVYVSLYGDPHSEANMQIIQRAEELAAMRHHRNPMTPAFFDAESANVWGDAA